MLLKWNPNSEEGNRAKSKILWDVNPHEAAVFVDDVMKARRVRKRPTPSKTNTETAAKR